MIAMFMIRVGLFSLGAWFLVAGINLNIKPSDKNYEFWTKTTKALLFLGIYMTFFGGVMYAIYES